MKKKFFLIGAVAAMSLALVSCAGNDGCTCTWTEDGEKQSLTVSQEELEEMGYKNCKAVQNDPDAPSDAKCK